MKTLSYTIQLEPAEEGGYTVTVPALPAVITEGDTYDEAVAMAREAIGLYLRYLEEEGRPIPREEFRAAPLQSIVEVEVGAS